MRVIPPVTMTDATITSSTAAEPFAPPAYSASTTYGYGDIVAVAADFQIYEALAGGNLNNPPLSSPAWWRVLGYTETAYNAATAYNLNDTCSGNHRIYQSLAAANQGNALPVLPATSTDYWIDVGATNKWAMFDLARNTQTVFGGAGASTATIVVTPGVRINSLALLGLVADAVSISVSSGGRIVYPYAYDSTKTYSKGQCCNLSGATTYKSLTEANLGHSPPNPGYWSVVPGAYTSLATRNVLDGYDYFFMPFATLPSVIVFDIPPNTNNVITITLTRSNGNIKCGSFVVGTYGYCGESQYTAMSDALNFSTISRDLYGNSTLIPRRTVPKTVSTLRVASTHVSRIIDIRTALNAVPAVWSGLDDTTNDYFEALLILGVYKQFSINADQPSSALISLELEEI